MSTSIGYATRPLAITSLVLVLSACNSQINDLVHEENRKAYERGEITAIEYGENEKLIDQTFND